MDLGGVSTQITFATEIPPIDSKYDFVLGENVYPLYSHSYAGFGNDAVSFLSPLILYILLVMLINEHCRPVPRQTKHWPSWILHLLSSRILAIWSDTTNRTPRHHLESHLLSWEVAAINNAST